MKPAKPKKVIVFQDDKGKEPYTDWLYSLKDLKAKIRIADRVDRIETFGVYGDCKPVGGGVLELRVFVGAGYRVYFAEDGDTIVILLCGGDKATQRKDIKKAQEYLEVYYERKKEN